MKTRFTKERLRRKVHTKDHVVTKSRLLPGWSWCLDCQQTLSEKEIDGAKKVQQKRIEQGKKLAQYKKLKMESKEMILQTGKPEAVEILEYRLGLGGQDKHTFKETAEKFGVSRGKVYLIEKKAKEEKK